MFYFCLLHNTSLLGPFRHITQQHIKPDCLLATIIYHKHKQTPNNPPGDILLWSYYQRHDTWIKRKKWNAAWASIGAKHIWLNPYLKVYNPDNIIWRICPTCYSNPPSMIWKDIFSKCKNIIKKDSNTALRSKLIISKSGTWIYNK